MRVHDHAKRVKNPSPPFSPLQRVDQFIQLVRDGLHLALCRRVAYGHAERAYGVRVVARAAVGTAGLPIGHFTGRTVISSGDAESEKNVAAVEARLHGGVLPGVQGVHGIDDRIGHGRPRRAIIPTGDAELKAHVGPIETASKGSCVERVRCFKSQ